MRCTDDDVIWPLSKSATRSFAAQMLQFNNKVYAYIDFNDYVTTVIYSHKEIAEMIFAKASLFWRDC